MIKLGKLSTTADSTPAECHITSTWKGNPSL